jgi:hypothetical protein
MGGLPKYTAGATKEGLNIPASTVQAISAEYCTRRKQFKKCRLAWRKSGGSKRSLGWIPFKKDAIVYRNGQIFFKRNPLAFLSLMIFKTKSLSVDLLAKMLVDAGMLI